MNTRTPKYQVIADELEKEILTDKYKENELIPSEAQLMQRFEVSRITIRRSIEILKDKGLISSSQGLGNIVTRHYEHQLNEVSDIHTSFVPKGIENKVIEFRIEFPNTELAKRLKIAVNELVYYAERERYYKGRLIILEICYLPVKLFPDLTFHTLQNSIFAYVESIDKYHIQVSEDEIIPEVSSDDLALKLQIKPGSPVLKIESTNYLDNNLPFQYSIAYHRSDNYRLKIKINHNQGSR